jgi:glutathione S-transferase
LLGKSARSAIQAQTGGNLRLYVHPASYNSSRALAAAFETGTSVEIVIVDLLRGEQRGPDYLRLNPMGRVPLLEDGALRLPESAAIMWTFAERSGRLLPENHAGRAEALRWISWDLAHLGRAHDIILFEQVIKGLFQLGSPDASAIEAARSAGDAAAAVLEEALTGQPFLVSGGASVADLFVAGTVRSAAGLGVPWASAPHTARWLAAVEDLPGCRAARARLAVERA